MYLKKLELNGFKSFARPTSLELSSGITAIVGPNGSGKSNIADAIRWILGEQSMKSIRSQSSGDLIFSGSKSKSRLGKANVCLYFDNSRGCIPLDFSEVVISRTIFRDGVSEYFINKNPTRLMDIVEILAKANIGHRGFSVINQGMEAEILKYSPSKLYELLEEASGVRYLQLKKRRAERQLKATQTNLEKVSSVLAEITPHLRYLKREATKAERKEKLKEKLVKLQNQFFFWKINNLKKQRTKLETEEKELNIKISELKNEVFKLNGQLQKEEVDRQEKREKFSSAQKEVENILNQRAKLSEKLAELRVKIRIEKENLFFKEKNSNEIKLELSQAEKEFNYIYQALKKILKFEDLELVKKEIVKVLRRMEGIIKGSEGEKTSKNINPKQLDELIEEQKKIESLFMEINRKYEEQTNILRSSQQSDQENFFKLERDLRRKKDNLSDLKSRAREMNWSIKRLDEECEELKEEARRAELSWEEIIANEKIQKFDGSLEELEKKINRFKYKLQEIGGVDEMVLQEYQETKERYDKLSKKFGDLKKAKKNLEDLIKQLTKEITGQFEKNSQTINDNFNKYLRLLFGGGRGYLKQISNSKFLISNEDEEGTEQEEEIASKGIEIRATLPGKKIKDLRMFSGGEKSLISIALLFAIISSNPPPFLVLDEVDATLDESNARRFAKLIREFSKDTQFIIITHNRETMNQADVLYGITMGDDGVSKLLSLKLEK